MKFTNPNSSTHHAQTPAPENDQYVLSESQDLSVHASHAASDESQEGPSAPKKKRSKLLWVGLPLMLTVSVGLFLFLPSLQERFGGKQFDPSVFVTDEVERSPFQLSVTERGTISSSKNATMINQVEGTTTIISIVPEGTIVAAPVASEIEGRVTEVTMLSKSVGKVTVTADPLVSVSPFTMVYVKTPDVEHTVAIGEYARMLVKEGDSVKKGDFLAGDVVCELDMSVFEDKLREQRIALTKAEGNLTKSRSNVETQVNQNESDMAQAELDRELSKLDLEKFREGESKQDLFEATAKITLAEQKLAQARESYEYTRENVKLGFEKLTKQEADRIAKVDAELQVDITKGKLKVLQDYDHKRTLAELDAKADESDRALERARLNAKQALEFYRAEYNASKETYDLQLRKRQRLEKQVKRCVMVAPQGGKVVYAKQSSRRSEPVVIEEGVQVRERQPIINLPDFTQMKVETKIHESKISHVAVGQEARIRVNAFPDRIFEGVLELVPDVPVRGEWPNMDQMLYETEVRIVSDVSELKPGMNAELEIVSEERDDVLQIPIQALVSVGDKYVSYVLSEDGPEIRHDVQIGASNDKSVEVVAGLTEGEKVIMNPRTLFDEELSELQAQYDETQSKERAESSKTKKSKNDSGKKDKKKKKSPADKKLANLKTGKASASQAGGQ